MKGINWYQEELDKFYGDNNNGYVYGIDTEEDIVWYKTEEERDKVLKKERRNNGTRIFYSRSYCV